MTGCGRHVQTSVAIPPSYPGSIIHVRSPAEGLERLAPRGLKTGLVDQVIRCSTKRAIAARSLASDVSDGTPGPDRSGDTSRTNRMCAWVNASRGLRETGCPCVRCARGKCLHLKTLGFYRGASWDHRTRTTQSAIGTYSSTEKVTRLPFRCNVPPSASTQTA